MLPGLAGDARRIRRRGILQRADAGAANLGGQTVDRVADEVRAEAIVVAIAELPAEPEVVLIGLAGGQEETIRVERRSRRRVVPAPLVAELAEPGAEPDVRRARVVRGNADACALARVVRQVRVALR